MTIRFLQGLKEYPSSEGVEAAFADVALRRFLELRELHWYTYFLDLTRTTYGYDRDASEESPFADEYQTLTRVWFFFFF